MCVWTATTWQVHAFDPTTPYMTQLDGNVTFRCWGLTGGKSDNNKGYNPQDHTHMGSIMGPLASLDAMMVALGHTHRDVQVLKIDCASHSRCTHRARRGHAARQIQLRARTLSRFLSTLLASTGRADRVAIPERRGGVRGISRTLR